MSQQPITESPNPLTSFIDIANSVEIVDLLFTCDKQIFDGCQDYPNISSEEVVQALSAIANVAEDILRDPDNNTIIISGCGTSGRLAFHIARSFNGLLDTWGFPQCFQYIIAGGDKALLTSQEAPEDNPNEGIERLKEASNKRRKILFIGVTCGLSAPFIAGQIDFCLEHLDTYTPVLLGFNPVKMARNIPVENWDKTFLLVANRLLEVSKQRPGAAFMLNPIVGPEAITGSSRMKSGSATKILLEIIFTLALYQKFNNGVHSNSTQNFSEHQRQQISTLLGAYLTVRKNVQKHREDIAKTLQAAGNSLNSNSHVYYIGWDSLGIAAIIDASECPPTFGVDLVDVRGFLHGGYTTYKNKEGDLSKLGEPFCFSLDHFLTSLLPVLNSHDTVIMLVQNGDHIDEAYKITTKCRAYSKNIHTFYFPSSNAERNDLEDREVTIFSQFSTVDLSWIKIEEEFSAAFTINQPRNQKLYEFLVVLLKEISVKWILNAVSTGANIHCGKVFKNLMVDLKVSNSKLFRRAIKIIMVCSNCSEEESKLCLLKSIYNSDTLTSKEFDGKVSQHLEIATKMAKIVPVAIVTAIKKWPISKAKAVLVKSKAIRTAIAEICQ